MLGAEGCGEPQKLLSATFYIMLINSLGGAQKLQHQPAVPLVLVVLHDRQLLVVGKLMLINRKCYRC